MSFETNPPTPEEIERAQLRLKTNWSFDEAPPTNDEIARATETLSSMAREKDAESKISMPKAIATKVVQGASSGLADEIGGIGNVLTELQKPGEFSMDEVGRRFGWDAISTSYEQGRDKIREQQDLAQTAYPKASMASEVVGAFVSPLNKVMPLSVLKTGIVQGALSGFGNTEAKDASGIAAAIVEAAGMGGAIGYGVDKIAAPMAKWGAGTLDDVKSAKNMDGAGGFGGQPPPPASGSQSQKARAFGAGSAKTTSSMESGRMEIENSGELFEMQAPKSIEEMRAWNPPENTGELPSKVRFHEIQEILPEMRTKPTKLHEAMLDDPKAMKKLKIEFENLPTEDATKMAIREQEMVNESGREVQSLVQKISKDEAKPMGGAGSDFIQSVKDKHHGEKSELTPIFKEFRANAVDLTKDEVGEVVGDLQLNTKIGQLIKVKPAIPATPEMAEVPSKIVLAPFSTKIGITKKDYAVAKEIVKDLNSGASFEELQKMREYLRNNLNPLNYKETQGVEELRDALLDSMNKMIAKRGGNYQAIAQRYAINEKTLSNIEKIIGPVSKLDETFSANPERVVDKIFSNPNYVKFIESYLGKEAVNKMVSSFVTDGIKTAYSELDGFNPVKLRQWMKTKSTFLTNYVDPNVLKKLSAWADHGTISKRFLYEVNPAGTAASIIAAFKPKSLVQKISNDGFTSTIVNEVSAAAFAKVNQNQAIDNINQMMGKPPPPPKPSMMSKVPNLSPEVRNADIINAAIAGVNSSNTEKKWADNGSKTIMEADKSIDQAVINELVKTKKGFNLLVQSSYFKKYSSGLSKMIEKIKQSDEYKKAQQDKMKQMKTDESKKTSSISYPKTLKKDGFSAVVAGAAESQEKPLKGEARFINDGIKKIQGIDSDALPDDVVKEMMKTMSGRQILIQASELKKGPTMDKLIKKINDTYKGNK